MKYRMVIEDAAQDDLESIVLWLAQHSEAAAIKCYRDVRAAIRTLADHPLRCPLAPENASFSDEIRHLLRGRKPSVYRILFTVDRKTVHVLHIRHGARLPLGPTDD